LRPEDSYLRPVVTDGQQQRLGAIINGGVGEGVLAGLDEAEQALERQRVGERDLNMGGGGLLRGDDLADPLARHEVHDRDHREPTA
jgi:hypothetical protein